MNKRYYYEIGIEKDSMQGYLMADSHQDSTAIIIKHLKDLGINSTDINYLNINHEDGDDILGIQFEEIGTAKLLMKDVLMQLNISPADLKNGSTPMTASTNAELLEYLGM